MIGRDEEQSALHAFLAAVPGGPAALVLTGTAGAGKTTLWKAGLAGALERSYRVLQTSPAQSEAALSFAGVADLLDEVLEESVASLPAPQRRALEVALLLSEAEGPAPDQRAVGVAFLGAVRALSQRGSIVVAVDDVQWLDAASTAALAFAARRLRDEPAGWLLAQRADGEAAVPLALDRALPEERLRRLEVGPLGIDDLHRLLRARLGASFSRPVLRRLHETAGGNPFFALELARALERGSIAAAPGEPLPVPANLRELVRSRLEALPPETREALTVAAALAQPTLALTGAVAQTDAAECLRPAVQADVVGLEDERIRFTHPLLASGSYEAASTGARRRIHARIAELVDDPEERARHLALAVAGPDAAVAASLDDAAHRAHARGSQGAAAELSDQAFRLTPPEHPREARRRAVESASYAFMAGDTPRARGLLEDVLEQAPPGPERALALARLAALRAFDDDLRAAEQTFREAAREAGDDPAARLEALEGLSSTLFRLREHLDEAVAHTETVASLALSLGRPAQVAHALGHRALCECLLGRAEAAQSLRASLALREESGELRILQQPELPAAVFWMWTDEPERARVTYERLLRRASERGDESSLAYVLVLLGQVECLLGDFEAAAGHAQLGHQLAEQTGQQAQEAYLLGLGALAGAHAGRVEEARDAGERSLALAESVSATPARLLAASALGLLELSLGRPAEAIARLEALLDFVERERIVEPGATRFVVDAVEALIELGRTGEAARLLGVYESSADRLGRASARAASLRCRAMLAAATGDLEGSFGLFERALAEHESAPLPFDRARTLLALGGAERRAKRKRAAREALEQALAAFQSMGAAVWAERTQAELRRISGRAAAGGGLTPTEQRVADLVAEGRTNREVAAALFVSDRTVEGHLSHIYSKLGVRSRTELARRRQSQGDSPFPRARRPPTVDPAINPGRTPTEEES